MAKRFNIRMAGVGGQGVVTGSHILSTAVIHAGGESTIVPFYGSEKRMAPVESYVRVSDEPIYEIGEITFPHIIIIFHPQVITHGKSYTMPFYFGLKEDGVALINNDGPMKLHRDQAASSKNDGRSSTICLPQKFLWRLRGWTLPRIWRSWGLLGASQA